MIAIHPPVPSTLRRWSPLSIAGIVAAWAVLQIGGLFSPGLLDDVDSIYIQIAREMLGRHDFVTPTIDGIRFFDKPPLMYWMAAGSMRLFGVHDWAARLPLALGMLALLLAVYALGIRLFARASPTAHPDRAGLYAALALATSIGPYLYTRFYIPDILIALWMTLAVHCFLLALDRIEANISPLVPMLGFAVVTALSVLTKGLIGLVFPVGFVLLFLALTRQLRLLLKLHPLAATAAFLLVAAPWHILAAIRNPAIPMPPGLGLPARAGWAWFYLYNEHIARFLGRRIPHDYGQVPIPLFWALLILWLVPWAAFLPAALANSIRSLRTPTAPNALAAEPRSHAPALPLLLWAGLILGFFTLSSRQEYYHLPALPALALLAAGLLAAADRSRATTSSSPDPAPIRSARQCLQASLYMLLPLGSMLALVCAYFAVTAPTPAPGAVLDKLLANNPEMYNLSLGHIYDLTGEAMGFFRGPLITVAIGMTLLGPAAFFVRRSGRTLLANLLIAAAMCGVLTAAHQGLVRFYPTLGSKELSDAILADRHGPTTSAAGTPVLIDGELTSASSVLFYLDNPVLLVNGRVNGPWFGSFWPDARPIFLADSDLFRQWRTRSVLYLLTYHPERRIPELCQLGPVRLLAYSGGDSLLRNAPPGLSPSPLPGTDACAPAAPPR